MWALRGFLLVLCVSSLGASKCKLGADSEADGCKGVCLALKSGGGSCDDGPTCEEAFTNTAKDAEDKCCNVDDCTKDSEFKTKKEHETAGTLKNKPGDGSAPAGAPTPEAKDKPKDPEKKDEKTTEKKKKKKEKKEEKTTKKPVSKTDATTAVLLATGFVFLL